MYLLIDIAKKDLIRLSFFNKEKKIDFEEEGRNRELLNLIDIFLCQEKINKDGIEGIMVVVGEGGFTSTRLAVTVANTFGYVLNIPLLAISVEQAKDPQSLILELLEQPKGQYISAEYSGEPNIGKVK